MADALKTHDDFRLAYRRKLSELLRLGENDPDFGLAAFVLACANAYFDGSLLDEMKTDLERSFARLRRVIAALLSNGQIIHERYAEDLLVFLKIGLVGLENLRLTEHRQQQGNAPGEAWRVQFNHIRSFRPQRNAARPVTSVKTPFNEAIFYYTPELCQRENFWSGRLEGKTACLLYNKYPFARLHALLLPEPEAHHPQFLDRSLHAWAWQAVSILGQNLPGFGMGYNSLGSFASVNHLHFQTFIEQEGMPVTSGAWQHAGGPNPYPIACQVFGSWQESWGWIERIHHQDVHAYNLLYTPGKIYCFERKRQGQYKPAQWTSGFAWFEVSGNLITFSQENFQSITYEHIRKECHKFSV